MTTETQAPDPAPKADLVDALEDALSVCRSVDRSKGRTVEHGGCTMHLQTSEWCAWLETEVGPKVEKALALVKSQAPEGALREAAQQALETLDRLSKLVPDKRVIENLRSALAAPAPQAPGWPDAADWLERESLAVYGVCLPEHAEAAQWLRDTSTAAAPQTKEPPMTAGHITQPYSLAEIKAKIATNEFCPELLLQHAMLLLDRQSPAEVAGEIVEMEDGALVPVWRDGTPPAGTKLYAQPMAAEGASMMPSDADIEWPDIDDLAHSAAQEAYSYGISHDLFKRWMTSAMFKTASAIRAAIIAKQEAAQPDVQPKGTTVELNKFAIFDKLTRDASRRTSLENVEDVLSAIAARYGRLHAQAPAPAPGLAPLTDERIGELYEEALSYPLTMEDLPSVRALVRKVEAALSQAPAVAHGWRPMRTAPKDGTAILVLIEASDVPYAVRWDCAHDHGWLMTWDNYRLSPADGPRYWMPCPADPDEAHPPVRKEDA